MKRILLICWLLLCSASYYGPEYEIKARKSLDRFGDALARQLGLYFLNSGSIEPLIGSKNCKWGLSLMCRRSLTLEEARPLANSIAHALLYQLHHNDVYANCLMETAKHHWRESPKIKDEYVGFRLAFWDANMDRPLKPYLAQIRFADGNFYYHYADPVTQALQEPIVEPIGPTAN